MEVHPRQSLNKHWIIGIIAALILIVASMVLLANWRKEATAPGAVPLKQVYFTDDDGQTWFADDATKVYPFDHGGKQAYRAYVFKCGESGKPFPAYLEQIKEETRTKIADLRANPSTQPSPDQIERAIQGGRQVRKPGTEEWIDAQSEAGEAITTPTCPDNPEGEVFPVFP
jgi:hypothetical protein